MPESARGRTRNAVAVFVSGGAGDEHLGPHPIAAPLLQKLQAKRRGAVFQRVAWFLVCKFAGGMRNLTTTPDGRA